MKRHFYEKPIRIFCLLAGALLMVSCAQTEAPPESQMEEETIPLPENLFIDFKEEDCPAPGEISVYEADFWRPDKGEALETLKENLLQYPIEKTEIHGEGPAFYTRSGNSSESLHIMDGGESFGTDHGVYGTFRYHALRDEGNTDSRIGPLLPSYAGKSENTVYDPNTYNTKTEECRNKELEFASMDSGRQKVEELFAGLGGFQIQFIEGYGLDYQELKRRNALYEEKAGIDSDPESTERLHFSEDDEIYVLFFRQVVDGITLVNIDWYAGGTSRPSTDGGILALFTKDGMIDLEAVRIYVPGKALETITPISAGTALENLINKKYNVPKLEKETRVLSCELEYAAVYEGEEYALTPVWVFLVQTKDDFQTTNDSKYALDTLEYVLVDAKTGEIRITPERG
jgi:hypothetical protein